MPGGLTQSHPRRSLSEAEGNGGWTRVKTRLPSWEKIDIRTVLFYSLPPLGGR